MAEFLDEAFFNDLLFGGVLITSIYLNKRIKPELACVSPLYALGEAKPSPEKYLRFLIYKEQRLFSRSKGQCTGITFSANNKKMQFKRDGVKITAIRQMKMTRRPIDRGKLINYMA